MPANWIKESIGFIKCYSVKNVKWRNRQQIQSSASSCFCFKVVDRFSIGFSSFSPLRFHRTQIAIHSSSACYSAELLALDLITSERVRAVVAGESSNHCQDFRRKHFRLDNH